MSLALTNPVSLALLKQIYKQIGTNYVHILRTEYLSAFHVLIALLRISGADLPGK